jgi:hypothetical protein
VEAAYVEANKNPVKAGKDTGKLRNRESGKQEKPGKRETG